MHDLWFSHTPHCLLVRFRRAEGPEVLWVGYRGAEDRTEVSTPPHVLPLEHHYFDLLTPFPLPHDSWLKEVKPSNAKGELTPGGCRVLKEKMPVSQGAGRGFAMEVMGCMCGRGVRAH